MNNQAMVFWGYAFKKKSWPCYIFSNYYKPTKKEKKSPLFFKWEIITYWENKVYFNGNLILDKLLDLTNGGKPFL